MRFSEVLKEVREWLEREGRISYLALQLEFDLSDKQVAALKEDLINAKRLAVDEDGKVLVWTGGEGTGESEHQRIGAPRRV